MKFGLIAATALAVIAVPATAQMTTTTRTTTVHHDVSVHTSPMHRKRKICSTHWGPHHHKITRCRWR